MVLLCFLVLMLVYLLVIIFVNMILIDTLDLPFHRFRRYRITRETRFLSKSEYFIYTVECYKINSILLYEWRYEKSFDNTEDCKKYIKEIKIKNESEWKRRKHEASSKKVIKK